MAKCKHESVSRVEYLPEQGILWKCDKCNAEFVPASMVGPLVAGQVAQQHGDTLDAMAGTLSAVLWDFHERAVEKYGSEVAAAMEQSEAEGYDFEPDDCPEHIYEGGICIRCGGSKFLGAE